MTHLQLEVLLPLWSTCKFTKRKLWAENQAFLNYLILFLFFFLWPHPAACDPPGCSPPGSSIHGNLQARILEWVAIPFFQGSSRSRDQTHVSCIGRRVLYHKRHLGSPNNIHLYLQHLLGGSWREVGYNKNCIISGRYKCRGQSNF